MSEMVLISKRGEYVMPELELKPCPFCGSEDFVQGFHEGHNEMRVKCKRCKTLFTIFDTPENAPKLWNRRTYCYQAERAVQDMTDIYKNDTCGTGKTNQ